MRPIIYSYTVSGRLPFPTDMLRYDQAWPARSEDAAAIEASVTRADRGLPAPQIRLNSLRSPTLGRWNSFSWGVDVTTLNSSANDQRCGA